MYNINSNHNFNQTYHDMILDKKSQTAILIKHTFYINKQQKWFFSKSLLSNHNHNNYHINKHFLTSVYD